MDRNRHGRPPARNPMMQGRADTERFWQRICQAVKPYTEVEATELLGVSATVLRQERRLAGAERDGNPVFYPVFQFGTDATRQTSLNGCPPQPPTCRTGGTLPLANMSGDPLEEHTRSIRETVLAIAKKASRHGPVEFVWAKGHNGHELNEQADRLARITRLHQERNLHKDEAVRVTGRVHREILSTQQA